MNSLVISYDITNSGNENSVNLGLLWMYKIREKQW